MTASGVLAAVRGRRRLRVATGLLLAAAAAWLAFLVTPPASVRVGPVDAQLAARPGSGSAVQLVHGRPVTDDVVAGPLALHLTLAVAAHPPSEPRLLASLAGARGHLVAAVARYLARVAVVAALLAALLAVVVLGRRARRAAGTAGLAVLAVLGSAGTTAATTRSAAFDAASCAHGWSRYVVADLPALTPQAPAVPAPPLPPPEGTVPLLLVADDHLNPEGLRFAQAVARQAHVAGVLDAGDTSSYGVPGEECVVAPLLRRFGVPYLWVRGNHDSPDFARAMRAVPGVRVLDGTSATVSGVGVYGLGDPTFTPRESGHDAGLSAEVAAARPRVLADLAAATPPPDVVLVHDCRMALGDRRRATSGLPPLLLCGHTHSYATAVVGGTLVLHTGTVGAGGLSAFAGPRAPFTAVVLYVSTTTHRLVRHDVVSGPGGGEATWSVVGG